MNFKRLLSVMVVLILLISLLNLNENSVKAKSIQKELSVSSAQQLLQTQPEFFTENKGQWDKDILFVGHTSFGKVAFTKEAVYYQLIKAEAAVSTIDHQTPMNQMELDQNRKVETQTIKLSFVNGQEPPIKGENILPHYHNYFLGNDSSKWASYCRNYTKVTYEDIWEGIDLAYFFTPEGMKYEYYVEPKADIHQLKIKVEGAEAINQGDSLEIRTNLGFIRDSDLLVFDQVTKSPIAAAFSLNGDTYSFQGVPEFRENPVVIDPLIYSTYLGGNDYDVIFDIAVDVVGNAFVTGRTESVDFPSTPGVFDSNYDPDHTDVFITKLNSTGTGLMFSTFLGTWSWDYAKAIAIDELGNVYITGDTMSSGWPVTTGAYDTTKDPGGYDGFVTKLNPTGSALIFSTFIGGSDDDYCRDIAVGIDHYIYISGNTRSTDFPTTPMAYQSVNNGENDIFVSKFNPDGNILFYSTYIGGSSDDIAYSIVLKASVGNFMNAYITGHTDSTDFPVTPGAFQTTFLMASEVFALKLDSYGSSLVYSTFLTSSGDWGTGYGIQVDAAGNAYVCGITNGIDFPVTPGAFQTSFAGGLQGFVSKLNPSGSALVYSTFLGGSAGEWLQCIQIDASGNAFISGSTKSEDFPTTTGAYQSVKKYDWDSFITELNPDGNSIVYSSFIGGNDSDECRAISLDINGDVYLAGYTYSTADFPISNSAYQPIYMGDSDGFITKLNLMPLEVTLTGTVRYNEIELNWNLFNPADIFILGYQIYRASVNNPFEPLAFAKGSYAHSYTDTTGEFGESYLYYIEAVDDFSQVLTRSNELLLGPIQTLPEPVLDLSIELNKHEFCYGDDVLYKVTVHNTSAGTATITKLQVTLPREIQYVSADKYRGEVQSGGIVLFNLGTVAGNSSVTFQINATVTVRTSVMKSATTLFYVSCLEEVFAEAVVNTTFISCDGGNPIPYVRVVLLNTKYDPETGERYIAKDSELSMDISIDGFTAPFRYEVIWGDGEKNVLKDQTEKKLNFTHLYTSEGSMEIQVNITDTSGKSRTVSARIKVK